MRYCHKCLQPDTRPNTVFSTCGICPACSYYAEIQNVNWAQRFQTLERLVLEYQNPNVQYDSIMGVSGGKDSTIQALWAKEKLGLNPLLVCLGYPPNQISDIGAANLTNLINLGFDVVNIGLAPIQWKQFMRASFLHYSNWCKSTEVALFASVPKIAFERKIPLILWGENPGLQVGDMATLGADGYDGNNLKNSNTLGGGNSDWLQPYVNDPRDLIPYTYPTEADFEAANLQIIYLGWFLPYWSQKNNGIEAGLNGLERRTEDVNATGELHGVSAIDEDFVNVNQMIKFFKFGFGKTTESINEMIRSGEITREDGIRVVEKYDGACDAIYIEKFCEYIDISTSKFWEVVHASMNTKLFEIKGNKISKKFKVGTGLH